MMSTKNSSSLLFSLTMACIFFSVSSAPVNPTYILGGVVIILMVLAILSYGRVQKYTVVTFLFVMLFIVSQLLGIKFKNYYPDGVNYLSPALFCYSVLISIGISESIIGLNKNQRYTAYRNFLRFATLFFLIELITRVLNFNSSKEWIYAFKFSVLYFDSNFTGLVILSVCSMLYFFKYVLSYDFKYYRIAMYIFMLLTLSRAAIFGLIVMRLYLSNHKKIKSRSLILLTFAIGAFAYLAFEYMFLNESYSGLDGSFNSKFYIVNKAIEFYNIQSSLVHWFGIGLGNTEQMLGIFAHNIYVTMFIEMGYIGGILFLSYILYTVKISSGYTLFVWVPVFITGISLFSAYSPFLFIITAIISYESNIYKKECRC